MTPSKFLKLFENASVLAFVGSYWLTKDLKIATVVFMVWQTLFVILAKVFKEKLNRLQNFTWIVALVLGGLTLFLQNDEIIKWKSTIVNGTISLVFGLSHVIGNKTLLERILDGKFEAPAKVLRNVNAAISVFLMGVACLNLVIARMFSTDFWVNFKFWGSMVINLIFISCVFYYLRDYLKTHFEKPLAPSDQD